MLAQVAHRHAVLTIPRLLRPLFRRRRELLTELGRAAAEATTELVRRGLGDDARPGVVVSIATAGDLVQWHPHLHVLASSGAFAAAGRFHPLDPWDGSLLMRLFPERLLARLVETHAISPELVSRLLAWKHPGFSAFVGQPIAPEDKAALEDVAAYLLRPPLSLEKLVYLDGQQAVLYRSKMNPGLGRNFEALHPLEWLARMCDHIPDPGRHRALFYGAYANRTRGARGSSEPSPPPAPRLKRCTPSWARLIAKVYGADPLVCRRCGGKLRIIAYITDSLAIKQILDLC